jgi:putative transposase
VLLILADLFLSRGIPTHIRSDNGPEFIANTPRQLRNALQMAPLYIEPGSPCENGCLNGELFYTLKEAQTMTEPWRTHYNLVRPHRSLGGRPPAPETVQLAN